MSLAPYWWWQEDGTSFWKEVQCHSLPVDHRIVMRPHLREMCNDTHLLLVIRSDIIRLPFRKIQYHSPPVGNKARWGETPAFRKTCNATHKLLVIGQVDVMRLPFRKMWNVTYCLLVNEQDMMRLPFGQRCVVTHFLLAIGQGVIRMESKNLSNVTHHLLVNGTRCGEIVFHENLQCHSHSIGYSVTRLPFRMTQMSPTCYWPWDKNWLDCISETCSISHTCCWSWEKIWWDCCLVGMNITHILSIMWREWSDQHPESNCMQMLTAYWNDIIWEVYEAIGRH